MSTRGLRGPSQRASVRNTRRRKMVRDMDLNVPPSENPDQEGTSAHVNSQDVHVGQQGGSVPPAPIDVDAFDDDVVISSPRAFAEAKNNSRRRRRRTVVVDVDSEESAQRVSANTRYKHRRVPPNHTILNCDLHKNVERSSNSMREDVRSMGPSPPPPPPKEPTFRCPVCMGSFVQEISTKCGHIFCKSCIKSAIATQGKCPTCRKKITMKDTHRVYLPATN